MESSEAPIVNVIFFIGIKNGLWSGVTRGCKFVFQYTSTLVLGCVSQQRDISINGNKSFLSMSKLSTISSIKKLFIVTKFHLFGIYEDCFSSVFFKSISLIGCSS